MASALGRRGVVGDVHAGGRQQIAQHDAEPHAQRRIVVRSGQRLVRGRFAAPQIGVVDDVVVYQRGGLEHLDRAGQVEHRIPALPPGVPSQRAVGVQRQ